MQSKFVSQIFNDRQYLVGIAFSRGVRFDLLEFS
jgi:hypothetical protein